MARPALETLISLYPKSRYWLERGVALNPANALVRAGIKKAANLRGISREAFLAIPRLGVKTLAICETALGRQLPSEKPEPITTVDLVHDAGKQLTREQWMSLGFSSHAVIALIKSRLTLRDLAEMAREELVGMRGIGEAALTTIEHLFGRRLKETAIDPAVSYWTQLGLRPHLANSLVSANFRSTEDLLGATREDIDDLDYFGKVGIARLEDIIGRVLPRRPKPPAPEVPATYWAARGLSRRIEAALLRAGIDSVEALVQLTRETFLQFNDLGRHALRVCEAVLGHALPSDSSFWTKQGADRALARKLTAHKFRSLQQLSYMSFGALIGMGYSWQQIGQIVRILELRWRKRS